MTKFGRKILSAGGTILVSAGLGVAGPGGAAHAAGPVHGMGLIPATSRAAVARASLAVGGGGSLPASVDLTPWTVPIGDQGRVGSCAAWAVDYAMLGWYSRHDAKAGQPFAPMFAYSQIAKINGGDNGASFDQVFGIAKASGTETKAEYPQGDFDYAHGPTPAERYDAANYKISGWKAIFAGSDEGRAAVRAIKSALARNQPVALGLVVRSGFDDLGAGESAVDNDTTTPIEGSHAVLAVGYNALGVLIQNSWGTSWGHHGFGRLSWSVIERDVSEAYTMNGFTVPTVQRTGQRTLFEPAGAETHLNFGNPGDVPLSGDWNGDGIDTPGVFRDGTFYLRNSNTTGPGDIVISFGSVGDIPVVGDWNGDGTDTVGVVHGTTWYLRNSNTSGVADITFTYGRAGEIPIVGDWNGDHVDTPGVVHGNTWSLRNSESAGKPDVTFHYGDPGDARVVGDWNGDGVDTPAARKGNTWYLRNSNTSGGAQRTAVYGNAGDVPLAGRYLSASLGDVASTVR